MMSLDGLEFRDGTTGARYSGDSVREAMADSWEYANTPVDTGLEWTVDDLEVDDFEGDGELITVDVLTLAELLRLARIGAQYAGCSVCRRVTLV
jgi:hypothetical protein